MCPQEGLASPAVRVLGMEDVLGPGVGGVADGRGMFVRSERRPVISDVASYSLATEKSTVKIKIKFT
jgi:hypothetical protein